MNNRNNPDSERDEHGLDEQEQAAQQQPRSAVRNQGRQSPDGSGGSGPGEDEGKHPVIINR